MTNEDRTLGKEFLSRVEMRYPKHQVADVLRRGIIAFEREGDKESARIMRLALKVHEEERAGEKKGVNWRMLLSILTMVLFVLFCAGYEGARRSFLAQDRVKAAEMERLAEHVESMLDGDRDARTTKLNALRKNARAGNRTAKQVLGLLMLTGRGEVEDPVSEPVMVRTWSLFGFSLYFGLVIVAYYVIRPIWFAFRSKSGCSTVVFMAMLLASFYIPGLIVFHYSRQWYPAFSAWIAKFVSQLF